jgi:hypothetical protein
MKKELTIDLDGTGRDRSDFLDLLTEPIDALASDDRFQANGALMFFREIVKNIYDHAGGKGKATFVPLEDGFSFRIEDCGKESHDLVALKSRPSSKQGNGVNYGVGLDLIEGMARDLGIREFKVDCSRGFVYSGVYPYEARA